MSVTIAIGLVLGMLGFVNASSKFWPDFSNKIGTQAPIMNPSVALSSTDRRHDIKSLAEPTADISSLWHQRGDLPASLSKPDDSVTFPTANKADQQMLIPSCAQNQGADRPQTGTRLMPDEETSGASELRVKNGTARDAAVLLVDKETGTAVRFVFIEARDEYTLRNIAVGDYVLRFVSGSDWIQACSDFLYESVYSEFENTLSFEALRPTNEQDGYTTKYEVTLNPVPNGKARKKTIDRTHFFEGFKS